MLPVKNLVYPGAVETSRTFTDAFHGHNVDGNKVDNPAYLSLRFEYPPNTDYDDVRTWYQQQLSMGGWQPSTDTSCDPKFECVAWTTVRDGLSHRFHLGKGDLNYRVQGDPSSPRPFFAVTYSLDASA